MSESAFLFLLMFFVWFFIIFRGNCITRIRFIRLTRVGLVVKRELMRIGADRVALLEELHKIQSHPDINFNYSELMQAVADSYTAGLRPYLYDFLMISAWSYESMYPEDGLGAVRSLFSKYPTFEEGEAPDA